MMAWELIATRFWNILMPLGGAWLWNTDRREFKDFKKETDYEKLHRISAIDSRFDRAFDDGFVCFAPRRSGAVPR